MNSEPFRSSEGVVRGCMGLHLIFLLFQLYSFCHSPVSGQLVLLPLPLLFLLFPVLSPLLDFLQLCLHHPRCKAFCQSWICLGVQFLHGADVDHCNLYGEVRVCNQCCNDG